MPELFIDIETFSDVDLKRVGVYPYAASPRFEVLMVAWAIDDDPVKVEFNLDGVLGLLHDTDFTKIAFNAQFERVCLGGPGPWHDPAVVAMELGYPANLAGVSEWLGGEQKSSAGTRLISYFCKPNRKGERNMPEDAPEDWADFVEYCRQDVVTLRDIHRRLGADFPTDMERRVYEVDQKINDRGLRIDLDLARAAHAAAEENQEEHMGEAELLTGLANPNSGDQLKAWFKDTGKPLKDLRAETVEALLAGDDLTPTQRRVLELRQELALTAAKKFTTALSAVSPDGRLRGSFRFFGAHTGRWTGKGVQPQNLPRHQLATETDTDAAILDLYLGLGASSDTLKALVRALFVGPFTVVDYASIEARVLAWMADERWALDAFADGRDIYVETAERMGGLTRSQGKVAVLALGYNGGVTSLRAMGAEGDDATLQRLVDAWRGANGAIRGLWRTMGDAFRLGGPVGEHITIEVDGDDRYMRLPSGRAIGYHDVKHTWVDTQYGRRLSASFRDPKQPGRVRTYGGKLTENATQAIARDVLAEALVRLDDAGYDVVAHVHDEIIVEAEDIAGVTELMTQQPTWAAGMPIDAEGFVCRRYRKG